MNKHKITVGIDLLWVRPGYNGGAESYIRNILDGLSQAKDYNFQFILYLSKDNAESFEKYVSNSFCKHICDVNTSSNIKRIVWENLHLNRYGIKDKIDVWFFPVYSRPFFVSKAIPVITTIHDIQAVHFPEYFSSLRNIFFNLMWKWNCRHSDIVLTISEFCKEDIVNHFEINPEKVKVIYNPIISNTDLKTQPAESTASILGKYGLEQDSYIYTVSSLAKHKNLITLLKSVKLLKEQGWSGKLVITGVKVNAEGDVMKFIAKNNLSDVVVYTGFIDNRTRDILYDNCAVFCFPSIFEGFGMPPIEAMERGVPTITTKCASLYEVTQGKAVYVDNPFDEREWTENIKKVINEKSKKEKDADERRIHFIEYDLWNITEQYKNLFKGVLKERKNSTIKITTTVDGGGTNVE